jgi:hypothetical protein
MELQEFIKESLIQIVEGVSEAQEEVRSKGAVINPTNLQFDSKQIPGTGNTEKDKNISRLIDFDIAVTTTEGSKTKGGIGIHVGMIGLGSTGQSEAQNSSMSRLKFSVPILFPGVPMEKVGIQTPAFANHEYDPWSKQD